MVLAGKHKKMGDYSTDKSSSSALDALLQDAEASGSPNRDPKLTTTAHRLRQTVNWKWSHVPLPFLTPENADDIFRPVTRDEANESKQNRYGMLQLQMIAAKARHDAALALPVRPPMGKDRISNMGLLNRLPGELRNQIYRDLLVSPDITLIECREAACSRGACEHAKISNLIPLACTCQQIRYEAVPIFCAENKFKFNEPMVRNRCVANWVESMGSVAKLIPKIVLQIELRHRSPPHPVSYIETLDLEMTWPSGRVEILYPEAIPEKNKEFSGLDELVDKLNAKRGALQERLIAITRSDELSDLAWRCRK